MLQTALTIETPPPQEKKEQLPPVGLAVFQARELSVPPSGPPMPGGAGMAHCKEIWTGCSGGGIRSGGGRCGPAMSSTGLLQAASAPQLAVLTLQLAPRTLRLPHQARCVPEPVFR